MPSHKEDEELLKLEYAQLNSGYNSRDQLTQAAFTNIVRNFNIFLVVLFAFHTLIKTDLTWHSIFVFVIGLAGFLALFVQTADLASDVTCKVKLRERATVVEQLLSHLAPSEKYAKPGTVSLWYQILNRDMEWEEGILKRAMLLEKKEAEARMYLRASRLLYGVWVAACLVIGFKPDIFVIY